MFFKSEDAYGKSDIITGNHIRHIIDLLDNYMGETEYSVYRAWKDDVNDEHGRIDIEIRYLNKDGVLIQQKLLILNDELIDVANACVENNINIDTYHKALIRNDDEWEKGTFVTNSISHKIGFVTQGKQKITYMGINAGGACGRWDFRTNGDCVVATDEDNSHITTKPSLSQCKEFLNEFDEFETAFYNYVDKIIHE